MAIGTSSLTISPVHPAFAAEVSGVDLTRYLDDATFDRIALAFDDYSVLVFHGQALSDEQQMAFSERWGPLETTVRTLGGEDRLGAHIVDLSNTDAQGKLMGWDDRRMLYQSGNQLWHSDSSFMNPRAAYSMLHALVTPSWGGETQFADLRAAYDALDARTLATVADRSAEHYALHTRILLGDDAYTDEQKKLMPPAVWPIVDTHPGSGRKVLFVGVHARQIIGMSTAQSRLLLSDLLEHATQRERVYTHRWKVGDVVIWDNRATVHRGRRFDLGERRELRRTTINDTPEAMLAVA